MSRIAEAAEAIHALINSTPRTPSQAEIAAVIGEVLATPDAETQKLRDEWDGLIAQAKAASARLDAARGGSDESEVLASDAGLDDCTAMRPAAP
jgi:hypothetical protein